MNWFSVKSDGFFQPKVPKEYAIRREDRSCRDCGERFTIDFPSGDIIAAYKDTMSDELRWFPTYESGGYLDLLEQFVPEFTTQNRMTPSIFQKFEGLFDVIQERPATGGHFRACARLGCLNCGSLEVFTDRETIIHRPRLSWMRYDLRRLQI